MRAFGTNPDGARDDRASGPERPTGAGRDRLQSGGADLITCRLQNYFGDFQLRALQPISDTTLLMASKSPVPQ
jgi:hypothetical protein